MKLKDTIYIIGLTFIMLSFFSCTSEKKEANYIFQPVPSKYSGIDFSNDLPLDDDLNILNYIYYFNGGGVAVGDVNNDGLDDLFFTGNKVSNKLYINQGKLKFEDVTNKVGLVSTGWSTGAVMVDINADGWQDIYVCRSGHPDPELRKNLLYVNQGNGIFKEMAEAYGLADTSYSTQAAFFDYDLDGDLDMYLLNHMHQMTGMNNPVPKKLDGESENTDRLYRNDGIDIIGHPTFTNVSKESGITIEGFGLGLGVSDLNQDGYPDIYVSNDFISNDIMYMNQGNGTFVDKSSKYLKHQSHNGMGNDIADINNDGLTDILVLDMLPSTNRRKKLMLNKPNHNLFEYSKSIGYEPQYMRNTFQLNNGNFSNKQVPFSEIGQLMGISSTDWSWGGLMADYDGDGKKDIYITTGYLKDMTDLDFIVYRRKQFKFRTKEQADSIYLSSITRLPEVKLKNYFYKNNGNLEFEDMSNSWVSPDPGFSNGAIYSDLDNDGDLDIVTNNINQLATLLENKTANKTNINQHYLKINFIGDSLNPDGIGTKVWAYSKGSVQFTENYTSKGFQSSVAPSAFFAFNENNPDSLSVRWPNGKEKVYTHIVLDTLIELNYKDARTSSEISKDNLDDQLFKNTNLISYEQKEVQYSDFNIEPLIPQKFSNNGPSLAVGDINGDALEDLYIGGSSGKSGQFYVQNSNGSFINIAFDQGTGHEDMGALLFDSDNDGDNDLYVVSGGSEFSLMKEGYYQDRLYKNDGKGNFDLDTLALPKMNVSGSCVIAIDYDHDQDLDLFVGGLTIPGSYGVSPRSYLLENNNGTFKDVTQAKLKETELGMVSSALGTDINNDGWTDLMVVGKWMPITVFLNNKGDFSKKIIKNTSGWWNSINGGDFDNDGDIDYILGNLGKNSVFKASEKYPLELYLADFDHDGRTDPIITCYSLDSDGINRSYPFASRDLLADQMVFTKTNFKDYRSYANAQIEDIIAKSIEKNPNRLQANYLESAYLENLGNSNFKVSALPINAQIAPINGITIKDFDLDDNLDVLLTGNFYPNEVSYGQNDAFLGLLLKGNGLGGFTTINQSKSGFMVNGDARALARINTNKGEFILASVNNDSLKSFKTETKDVNIVDLEPDKHAVTIILENGKQRKVEIYYGEGYLSQSTTRIQLPRYAEIKYN